MDTLIIIKTTVNNIEVKKRIIKQLINTKLVACINIIGNISSTYLWKNDIVEDKEDILLIKTILKNEKLVYKTIKKYHNYDTPEIITIETTAVDSNYLEWVNQTIVEVKQ